MKVRDEAIRNVIAAATFNGEENITLAMSYAVVQRMRVLTLEDAVFGQSGALEALRRILENKFEPDKIVCIADAAIARLEALKHD